MTRQELILLRLAAAIAGMKVFAPVAAIISPPRNQGTAAVFLPLGQAGTPAERLGMPRSLIFNNASVFGGIV